MGSVSNLATLSPDGRLFVTASKDSSVRVWEMAGGTPASPSLKHSDLLTNVSFSSDGRSLITSSFDGIARKWSLSNTSSDQMSLNHANYFVSGAFYSPDGKFIVTSSDDGTARIWEASSGKSVLAPFEHSSFVNGAVFSPDGKRVATFAENVVKIWDASSGKPLTQPLKHSGKVTRVEFSTDGTLVITKFNKNVGGAEQLVKMPSHRTVDTISIWDPTDGKQLASKEGLCCSSNGKYYLTHSYGNNNFIYGTLSDVDNKGSRVEMIGGVQMAGFSPDSKFVFTACIMNKTARIWCATTGVPKTPQFQLHHYIKDYKFSRDGKRIAISYDNNMVRILDTSNGLPLSPPITSPYKLMSVEFSSDGNCVLIGTADGMVRMWDATYALPLSPSLMHREIVRDAKFSPNDYSIITSSFGFAQIWKLPLETRPPADLLKIAQVNASHRIDDTGGLQPLDVEKELIPWYNEMKAKYPEEFTPTYDQTRRWRLQQIADSCKERNLPAALFHQNWLLAEAVLEAAKTKAPAK